MRKQGVVVAVKGQSVVIRAERESSCSSCAGKSACGTLGSWDSEKKSGQYEIELPNEMGATLGDEVTVEVPDQLILTTSMKFYGAPVLAFIMAGAVSFSMAKSAGLSGDLFSALGGLLAAGATWFWLMKQSSAMEQPRMVAVKPLKSAT